MSYDSSEGQAGGGHKERSIWFELNKGDWRQWIKDDSPEGGHEERYEFVHGYYAGHEIRSVEASGNMEAHHQLVITLGGGTRPVKCSMYYPSNAARMFASHLDALHLGDRIRLEVFKGKDSDVTCLLVKTHPQAVKLPRIEFPAELVAAVKRARQAMEGKPKDSPEGRRAKRDLEDQADKLEAWILDSVLKVHPGWPGNQTAIEEADKALSTVDRETGEVDEYDPFADEDSPQTSAREQANRASVAAQAPVAVGENLPTVFGFKYARFPPRELFSQPASGAQAALLAEWASKANYSDVAVEHIRGRLLTAIGIPVAQQRTKGGTGLLIDFLMNAPSDSVKLAAEVPGTEPAADPYA